MSLCIRTTSNKLTLFVGTRKAATQIDRQLPKHIEKTSTFFDDFPSGGTLSKSGYHESILSGNLNTLLDNIVVWNFKLRSDRNWNIGRSKPDVIENVTKNLSNDCTIYKASAAVLSVAEKDGIVRSENSSRVQSSSVSDNRLGKPSQEQLNHVYEVLREDLPKLFIKSVDYSIYHNDIVFENNIKGTVTRGIYEYVKQTAMLRIIGHLKFAFVKFDVLKITVQPEDSSVKVRWRIRAITGSRIFFKFWKYKLWDLQSTVDQLESWHDGFSTFYVDGSGKVIKHVADKMMPDQDNEILEKNKTGMAGKLTLFSGLFTPREFLMDIVPLMSISIKDNDSVKTFESLPKLIE